MLAGGQGSRLRTLTGRVPKQFWSYDGSRTLVEHTIDRISALSPRRRTVTVIGPNQLQHVDRLSTLESLGRILQQPADRGTGVGVLWGLSVIAAQDPSATVLLTPADHGVGSTPEFRHGIRMAVRAVAAAHEPMVLFGVTPTEPSSDYGWIVPTRVGNGIDDRIFRPVQQFTEKPSPADATALMGAGAVWNTMVLVARAGALLERFRIRYGQVVDEAAALAAGSGPAPGLEETFNRWPVIDFSRDVMSEPGGMSLYTWPPSIDWCDLGTEARLRRWQKRIARPAARTPWDFDGFPGSLGRIVPAT